MKPKILIVGPNGITAWQLSLTLHKQGYSVVGLVSDKATSFPKLPYPTQSVNLSNPEEVKVFFKTHHFDVIIHSDHVCSIHFCEENPQEAWRINFENIKTF